jgi:hypothetical protein
MRPSGQAPGQLVEALREELAHREVRGVREVGDDEVEDAVVALEPLVGVVV